MCWCTPSIRTPFCGAICCRWPGNPGDRKPLLDPEEYETGNQLIQEILAKSKPKLSLSERLHNLLQEAKSKNMKLITGTDENGVRSYYFVQDIYKSGTYSTIDTGV